MGTPILVFAIRRNQNDLVTQKAVKITAANAEACVSCLDSLVAGDKGRARVEGCGCDDAVGHVGNYIAGHLVDRLSQFL